MTTKDLRIEYHKEAEDSPFDETFHLHISTGNNSEVSLYIEYLEDKVLDLINRIPNSKLVKG